LAGAVFFATVFFAGVDFFTGAAFFEAADVRDTTLRAAAPARLAKDFRLAVAMVWEAPIG
jgi:hypothetical protein